MAQLKAGDRDVIAVGGVTLAASLLAEDLVDEYRLLLLPALAGGGILSTGRRMRRSNSG